MIAQVFALQPEEPVPYMIAYLRKHGGAPDDAPAPKPEEASAWRQKYQDLAATYDHSTASLNAFARAAAEREAALAAQNQRLQLAYSARNAAVDLDSAEPYMFGHFA